MLKVFGVWMVIGLVCLQGGVIILLDTFAKRGAAQSEKNRAEAYLKKISPKITEEFLLRRYGTEWILLVKLATEDVKSLEGAILPLAQRYPKLLVTRSNGEVLEKKEKRVVESEPSVVSQTALLAGIAGTVLLILVWFAMRIRRLGNIRNKAGKMEKRFEDIRRRLDEQ
ncbi:hypothetical protein [Nitratifractor sp.]